MYEINLRNWRDERREKKTKAFIEINIYISVLIVTSLILIHLVFGSLMSNQLKINNYLKEEDSLLNVKLQQITEYENEIKSITERMKIINQLQGERTHLIFIFDEVAKKTPKEIRLTKMKKEGSVVDIEGVAVSQLTISKYLKELSESGKIISPRLNQVIADEKEDGFERSRFYIKAKTKLKNTDEVAE